MEKYSIEWKRARGAWVQDHITTDTTGSPCRVWKLHYIQHDTEYSRGEYRTKKEATTELSAYKAARALGSMTSPAKQASSRANGKRGGRPRITKYFSVGVGSSTDMERHPAPDFTCGHKHKSIEAAEECQRKLMAINPQTRQCSAKWYNSYIVGSSSTANSGWRGINDEKLYTD